MEQSAPPSFLLLLPAASSPSIYASLQATYDDTLTQVLKEVASASQESRSAAVLEVALACPHIAASISAPRDASYASTQAIVAGLYKLICVIAAREHINIEDADGVDVRVLLIAWSPDVAPEPSLVSLGPVIDLPTLAASQRPWQYAFGVESDQGEAFVRAFVAAKQGVKNDAVTQQSAKPADASARRHLHVAVGGTFDHIHVGHKLLLTMTAFAVDEKVAAADDGRTLIIGITGDELLKNKKYAEYLESWHDRQQSAYRFLSALIDFTPPGSQPPTTEEVNESGPNGHTVNVIYPSGLTIKFVEIWDPFGPTITEESISALIISAETRAGGKAVNDKRAEKGWPALEVLEVNVLDPEEVGPQSTATSQTDFESKLSSTQIRKKLSEKKAVL